jgi:methylmalonyl-CoA mutase cobalamin-binding subunit
VTDVSVRNRTVLLSTVPSDAHTWNLVFLQLLLEEHGHEVVNLGPCVPIQHLRRVATTLRPDAIVISSVNGHGHLDGERLIRVLRADPELADVPAVIGGKLGIDGQYDEARATGLLRAGYDAVITCGTAPSALTDFLSTVPRADRPRGIARAGAAAARAA